MSDDGIEIVVQQWQFYGENRFNVAENYSTKSGATVSPRHSLDGKRVVTLMGGKCHLVMSPQEAHDLARTLLDAAAWIHKKEREAGEP